MNIKDVNVLLLGYGYIGQYLYVHLKNKSFKCNVISANLTENNSDMKKARYEDLPTSFLSDFTHILWFAGHSSVLKSTEDPIGAIHNNLTFLFDLVCRLPKATKLVYASSASVYSGLPASSKANIYDGVMASLNAYDSTKKAFDILMQPLDSNVVGLRMGTVSGWSPGLRPELAFNQMNISAIENKQVNVSNKDNWRSLLFLSDLAVIIENELLTRPAPIKIINAASCNIQFGDLANIIARYHSVPVIDHGNSGSYSFQMELKTDKSKMDLENMIIGQCDEFMRKFKK